MADVEGETIDNKARLEALKQQESLIEEEKEELQKEEIKAVSTPPLQFVPCKLWEEFKFGSW